MSGQQKKNIITEKNGELGPGKGVLELPIPGEPGNLIIPLKEYGIRSPRNLIIDIRESGI